MSSVFALAAIASHSRSSVRSFVFAFRFDDSWGASACVLVSTAAAVKSYMFFFALNNSDCCTSMGVCVCAALVLSGSFIAWNILRRFVKWLETVPKRWKQNIFRIIWNEKRPTRGTMYTEMRIRIPHVRLLLLFFFLYSRIDHQNDEREKCLGK